MPYVLEGEKEGMGRRDGKWLGLQGHSLQGGTARALWGTQVLAEMTSRVS